ncbi:MAG TPA: T9SS C-terminal target domain-containing protein [Candidatus Kapabacteria bacterium]|nr:T9SS C-terminal target domain-containing protein [Candidatus Kapabacteria bacterium]
MIQWQKVFGRMDGEYGCRIIQTKDGGYIVAATCDSICGGDVKNYGGEDYWIIKFDVSGNIQWQKSYGGSNDDIATSIQQTKDGGYIIAGESNSDFWTASGAKISHGGFDYWIVKIDSVGSVQWQKPYGGGGGGVEIPVSIKPTSDCGYIIAGGSQSNNGDVTGHHGSDSTTDYWIVKTDSAGNIQWQKSYGGSRDDFAMDVEQTRNGNYIAAGLSCSSDGDVGGHHGSTSSSDYWIVEFDSLGTIKWQNSYGGSSDEIPSSVIQDSDGGFIIAGNSYSSDGDVTGHHGPDSLSDCWVVKIDSVGTIKWQKSYGGSGEDYIHSITQSEDGGYTIAGGSNSTDADITGTHGGYDYWIMKIDEIGRLQWQKFLGGKRDDKAYSIQQTVDGGYIVAGITQSQDGDVVNYTSGTKYWIVKLKNSPDK